MEDHRQQEPQQPSVVVERDEDFTALYANSVIAETSVWDMKVLFGIIDQSSVPNKVIQHTSINLPWLQIKLLSYYLRANLAIHEKLNGKIFVPQNVMPPDPETIKLDFPQEIREILSNLYKEFLAAM